MRARNRMPIQRPSPLGPLLLLILAPAMAACEGDELATAGDGETTECKEPGRCGDPPVPLGPSGGDGSIGQEQPGLGEGMGGSSMPPPPAPNPFIDVSGTYQTTYALDISSYLLGISRLANQIDVIDQTFRGNVHTGVPLLDAFIADIVVSFVPPWVANLVNVLNTTATLFDEVRVNGGRLTLTQDAPTSPDATEIAVHGTETWSELVLLIVHQCPGGRQDPNFPRCAELHVPITHDPANVGPVQLLVEVKPFDGKLLTGAPEASLVLENREIGLEMHKLILLALDTAVRVTTPYGTLDEALRAVVSCRDLGDAAYDYATDSLGISRFLANGVAGLVENQCRNVLDRTVSGFAGIGVEWDAVQFEQRGNALDQNRDGHADALATPNDPGHLDGRFRFAVGASLGGTWQARR